MSRLPALTAKQVLKILKRQGFVVIRQPGGHLILRHPDGRRTTLSMHAGRTIGRGLLGQIMSDAKLTREDITGQRIRRADSDDTPDEDTPDPTP